jgi:hypothetical protein
MRYKLVGTDAAAPDEIDVRGLAAVLRDACTAPMLDAREVLVTFADHAARLGPEDCWRAIRSVGEGLCLWADHVDAGTGFGRPLREAGEKLIREAAHVGNRAELLRAVSEARESLLERAVNLWDGLRFSGDPLPPPSWRFRRSHVQNGPEGVAGADPRDWITITEAAALTAINPGTISRAASRGEILTNGERGKARRLLHASVNRWALPRLLKDDADGD